MRESCRNCDKTGQTNYNGLCMTCQTGRDERFSTCEQCEEWVPLEELNEDNVCVSCLRDEDMGDWDDLTEEDFEQVFYEDVDTSGVDWSDE